MRHRPFARSLVAPAGIYDADVGVTLTAAATPEKDPGPTHDPTLEPRDEAAFLLKAAAEVEHMLMVHYLFAAYSLKPRGEHPEIDAIQKGLLQIAREEMGHLITVQNLLLLIGAPLNFRREHSPYASEIYPFRFKLEPVSLDSLAKYVVAESPVRCPPKMNEERWRRLVETIRPQAERANDGRRVMHVGPIFARLKCLFESEEGELGDGDFRHAGNRRQGRYADWGYDPHGRDGGERLIVESFDKRAPGDVRQAAVEAIVAISEQGEGFDPSTEGTSHFERFFDYYDQVKDLSDKGVSFARPLPTNPNTTQTPTTSEDSADDSPELVPETTIAAHEEQGRITHPRSRRWAQLLNLRYRMLLTFLSHFLHLDEDLYVDSGVRRGDHTRRGLLLTWTFQEMGRIRKLCKKLVQLPKDEEPSALRAGPPFELPYSLQLPTDEADRWRLHLDTSVAASRQVVALRADSRDAEDEFLIDLGRADSEARSQMRALAAGQPLPAEALPTDFQKTVRILEDAVRGFTINHFHGNFWDKKTRDQFVNGELTVGRVISEDFKPENSELVRQLEHKDARFRMPRFRPPIPGERIAYIKDWIKAEAPDNQPEDEPGIVRERVPSDEPQPAD